MHRLRGLYAIADTCSINTDYLLNKVAEALSAGVTIIQFRDKKNNYDTRHKIASELKILTAKHQALLIINDDILIAKSIDADGVHLGKEDCSITEARKFLGPNKIIGASCYNCYANASKAVGAGANPAKLLPAHRAGARSDRRGKHGNQRKHIRRPGDRAAELRIGHRGRGSDPRIADLANP